MSGALEKGRICVFVVFSLTMGQMGQVVERTQTPHVQEFHP